MLHNPRYAGAFAFGRTRSRRRPGGAIDIETLPRNEWAVLLTEAHPGYLPWDRFEANQKRLRDNARAYGAERRRSPPREGPALLQGLAVCGRCGQRMTVRYHALKNGLCPEYVCQREGIETASAKCQTIKGVGIDRAIGTLLVETVTPMSLAVALQVQAELEARADEAETLRGQRVQRARQDADLARRRFMAADPGNRLVVDVLEAEWNEKLRALNEAQEELEQRRAQDHPELSDAQRQQILALATDFPRLWNDPKTPQRERKRMVRLLLEDVTLTRGEAIMLGIRFCGGTTRRLTLPLEKLSWQLRQTSAQVIADIDALLDHHCEQEIADILNQRGCVSGEDKPFHRIT
ncbi:MAG: recombinase family protein, partial [Candidatus Acidiferrales bacterium]